MAKGKILKFYERYLALVLAWVVEDKAMLERIIKFHSKFLDKVLLTFGIVFTYVVAFWVYDSRGFQVAVIALLAGVLIVLGRISKNTKPYDGG